MNPPKLLQQIIIVCMIFLFLTGCGTPAVMPTLSPTLPTTVYPPTSLQTAVATPTIAQLMPGDKIGQMTLEVPSGRSPDLWEYCAMAWSTEPGVETVNCDVPWLPWFFIGTGWYAKEVELLNSNWEALEWELYVDGYLVNLDAFGTFDDDLDAQDGTSLKMRGWNVQMINPAVGEHTLRYVYHVNQEIDNGFEIIKPGIWEMMVNLNLQSPVVSHTATPVTPLTNETISWWNNTVFYEIFVRSFADSTTGPLANDGIGDLQGLIEKLDYLNDGDSTTTDDLGVTGIWLMPITQSPSYHGYDVTDYYTVDEDYGTNEDFKILLAEAHKRGIKVIMDLVLNHTSSEHPWFIEARDNPESERRDWYIWSDVKPTYAGPWGQNVWHPSASGYYYGLFWSGMPDLNYENPEVKAEMENVTRFWLEEVGVDGFRLDAARHLIEEGSIQENTQATHEWLKRFRTVYKASNPEALAVGEIWTENFQVIQYLLGDELDLAFDFDLAEAVVTGVMTRNAERTQKALTSSYAFFGNGLSATFLTNHDMNRVMSQLGMNTDKAKIAASVLLTAPGVPFIYYGEEIGTIGSKPDELIRTPMQWSAEENAGFTAGRPWEPVNVGFRERNVNSQSDDPSSLLSRYRELIHLRNDHPALQVGGYNPVISSDEFLLAYLRESQEESVLVVINMGEDVVSGYDLTQQGGSLEGAYQASMLYGGEAELPPLIANEMGGFDSYQPLPEIPAGGVLIIHLLSVE